NGKGKTTLLKLLAGTLQPRSGELTYHPAVSLGCYEQTHVSSLVESRTVEEEILYSAADLDRQKARNICGAMMFEGDAALKKIGVLSGGEKSRVMLGKLLARPLNLLLLDEPTNHLDIDSCDALIAALDCFEGTVVMVTHNEMFLHALAERLIVFQDERVYTFDGTYQRFLEKGGWHDDPSTLKDGGQPGAGGPAPAAKRDKKEIRRRRSGVITERSRALKPLEAEVRKTENAIEARERELEVLNADMQAASEAGDGSRIAAIGQRIHQCQSAIEQLFDALETASDAMDARNAGFDQKLARLEQTENGL
ncbi:MAG: ATP-binding cassette domain-containing protein, partial [Desulfobacterales bacterium]|nr:ATP-binding cassette domain-containing protein [Desulfobacterales bacterium]